MMIRFTSASFHSNRELDNVRSTEPTVYVLISMNVWMTTFHDCHDLGNHEAITNVHVVLGGVIFVFW